MPVISKWIAGGVTVTTGWLPRRTNADPAGRATSEVNSYEAAEAGAVTLLDATEPPYVSEKFFLAGQLKLTMIVHGPEPLIEAGKGPADVHVCFRIAT